MSRMLKWAAPVAALGLILSLVTWSVAQEEKKADKGSVTGSVVDKDGKPAANVTVKLMHAMGKGERKAAKSEENGDKSDKSAKKGDRPKAAAEATTDSEGKFTLSDVPAGHYVVMAGGRGIGAAREKVEVKGGESATVSLTLKEKQK